MDDRGRHVGSSFGNLADRSRARFRPVAARIFFAWPRGTALVYPTLLAAVSDVAHPEWRASAVGVYRLWRDGGYALGAILSGIVADLLGLDFAIAVIGVITFLSGVVTAIFMYETIAVKHPEEQ